MTLADPIVPVILCGGSGKRLWPLSRESKPKQFLKLHGEDTLLQATARRFTGPGFAPAWYLCNNEHRFLAAAQLQEAGQPMDQIILEPAGRGTAASAALAALASLRGDPAADPLLLVAPSDHMIRQPEILLDAVRRAAPVARAGWLVTFGIRPDAPESGYGYIQAGTPLPGAETGFHQVAQFIEKPARARAEALLREGGFYWNSGIFLFSARSFLAELERHAPAILAACRAALQGWHRDLDFCRIDADAFLACPAGAIDTAVMERTARAAMLPLDAGWSDIGTWFAHWQGGASDTDGNLLQGHVHAQGSSNLLLHSEGPLVAVTGISNLMVVASEDAVLVAPLDPHADIRGLVEELERREHPEVKQGRQSHRPWGSFRVVDAGVNYQVKHLLIAPGASLSLQKHEHRAEHWVVVSGTARVTQGDKVFLVRQNESTYISPGMKHRLENPGDTPLRVIEIQTGSYFGEDDIIRFEDDFGRV
ncbi:mannose-1-phosphate guanylyltransferase/mannose-6-phosphate isomerase [Ferrovibrio sp.]|uniref:mannose-1-phosphate guanylyltransferase/mannose-6-phosphate isomerase n=1 Tax=Ferrovibrio sp. TaxID=1917215 RepID=UPI003D1201EC